MTAPIDTPSSPPRWRGRRIAIVVASVTVVYAIVVGVFVFQGGPDASPGQQSAVLFAVGNLGGADSADAAGLADMLGKHRIDGLALLGDLAPPDGSASAWEDSYQPNFGQFNRSARPAPGDTEYMTPGASAYFSYFAEKSGAFAASPYYAFTMGGWRIYSLDSRTSAGMPGSDMYEWLRNDLRATTLPCVAAYWHDPVYTAGPSVADGGGMEPIRQLLAASGADVVLAAHDANYQRWAPIDGITSFVVGTGGSTLAGPTRADDRLAFSSASAAGALQLELRNGRADFQYLTSTGAVLDSGSIQCHGRPTADLPRPAVPTGLAAAPGTNGIELSWMPVDGDPAPIGYLIYRGSELIGFSSEPAYLDATLAAGASVLYAVRSVAATGARSQPSDSAHSGGGVPGYTDYTWAVQDANPAAPTADKPQSKLWWNDGTWWGLLYASDPTNANHFAYFIQRFDAPAQAWVNTGVEVDERNRSHADVLWDATSQNLYIVSTIHSGSIKFYRLSYDSGAYALDEGFPIRLTENGSESATIAKDSIGTLWVTMTQLSDGSGPCEVDAACVVRVIHSTDAEYHWAAPATLATDGTTVNPDDISAVVAFGGQSVGIAWSNQEDGAFYFATHADGASDTAWTTDRLEIAPRGADDHMNVKADGAGRVFMIGKTSLNDPANASPDSPLMVAWVRERDGTWRDATVWTVRDDVTRAEIVIDEGAGRIYAVAAQPGTGGNIYMKSAAISDLAFPSGLGTVLLASGEMNNPTLTKQTVNLSDGILVLAGDTATHSYWHNLITPELAGGGG